MLMNSEHCAARWKYVHMKDPEGFFLKDLKIFLKTVHQAWKERGTSVHKEPWRRRVAQIVEKCISCRDFWVTKNCDDDAEE